MRLFMDVIKCLGNSLEKETKKKKLKEDLERQRKDWETEQSKNQQPMPLDAINKRGSYYFIGPPRSGKTVFFVTMADRMLRMHIEHKDKAPYVATYATRETELFVTHSIKEMEK